MTSSRKQQHQTYLAVTADMSQLCDMRDLSSLRSNLDDRAVEPDEGPNEQAVCVHKVGKVADSNVLKCVSGYRPIASKEKRARRHESDAADGRLRHANGCHKSHHTDKESHGGSGSGSPRSSPPRSPKKSIDKTCSKKPQDMADSCKRGSLNSSTNALMADENLDAPNLKLKKSKRQDDLNVSLRKGRPSRRHSTDSNINDNTVTSPYISEQSKQRRRNSLSSSINNNNNSLHGSDTTMDSSTSSTMRMRRKSEPHHRDVECNLRVASIMKQPKYSSGFSCNNSGACPSSPTVPQSISPPPSTNKSDFDLSKLLDISNHKFNLDKLGLTSTPSSQQRPKLSEFMKFNSREERGSNNEERNNSSLTSTSISEGEDWLPKGVEFCRSMEVYVFKPYKV